MKASSCALLLLAVGCQQGWTSMTLSPWTPLFQGIDFARGTNVADTRIPARQLVSVVRIDLTDPDIRVLTTPRYANYLQEGRATSAMSTSHFLSTYGLQIA